MISWRHQYDEDDMAYHGELTKTVNDEPTLTQQSLRDETDINILLARMGVKDGSLLPFAPDPRYFGDFTAPVDFRIAMDNLRLAQERFLQLPADVRGRFQNDPARLLDWIDKPENKEEAVKLGLLAKDPPKPQPPTPTEVVIVGNKTPGTTGVS